MVCTAHRLVCKTLHFPKHKFPVCATWNVEINCRGSVGCIKFLFSLKAYLIAGKPFEKKLLIFFIAVQ